LKHCFGDVAQSSLDPYILVVFILTVVTVAALPMTIIPGLFGMNVGGLPLQSHAEGFWILVVLVTALSTLGAVLALRRSIDS
jgi:zinc transporter